MYKAVDYTYDALEAIEDRVTQDRDMWAAQGIDLTSWAVHNQTDRVIIREAKYSPNDAAVLQSHYGPGVDIYTSDFPIESGSRIANVEPWWGGDRITNGSLFCTSWFTVHDDTANYGTMLTAGHCGLGTWSNGSTVRGTVTADTRKWENLGDVDAERTGNTGYQQAYVWADPVRPSRTVTSVHSGAFITGTIVCFDGSVSGEHCTSYVEDPDTPSTYDGKTVEHQVFTEDSGGSGFPCAKGDSGGPVYSFPYSDGDGPTGHQDMQAYGMFVSAHFVNGVSGECFFTPAHHVLSAFSDALYILKG